MDREIIIRKLNDLVVLTMKFPVKEPEKYYDEILETIGADLCEIIPETAEEIVFINGKYYHADILYHLVSDAIDKTEIN